MRNVLALGLGQVFTWGCTAGLTVLLPRYLGDEHLGKLSIAISLTDLCGLVASLGITSYLTKEIARRGVDGRADVLNALAMRVPLVLLASALAITAAHVLGYDPLTTQLTYLLCINLALSAVGGVLVGALQGLQEMRAVTVANALSKGVMLALIAVLFWQGYGLLAVGMAWNVAGLVTVLGYLVPLVRLGALGGALAPRTWRRLLMGSMPFFVWQTALMVYGQSDVILLSLFTRDAVVGWYAAAYRIISIPVFFPTIVAAAVFPALSRSAHDAPDGFVALARRSLQSVLLVTLPMALGTMVLAGRLLEFLRYPEAFANSVPIIIILALHIPLVGVDMITGYVLNALDKQRWWALTGVAAAMLNPTLNWLFIPYFETAAGNGAIGAATVTVITELFMLTMGMCLLRGRVFDRGCVHYALRALVAGLVMLGAVAFAADLALPLTVALGALVYAAASFALRTVAVDDVRLVVTYLRERRTAAGYAPD